MPEAVLLSLPDWRGSAPGHWLSDWEARLGLRRVEQHDWHRPLRGDWIARLEESVLALGDGLRVVLVADGLGCLQAAAWAAHSRQAHRLHAVFLAAPRDLEAGPAAAALAGWRRPAGALPAWKGCVAPGAAPQVAARLAREWGLPLAADAPPPPASGPWPEGEALLRTLAAPFHVKQPTASGAIDP
jgi:hypothetical protein